MKVQIRSACFFTACLGAFAAAAGCKSSPPKIAECETGESGGESGGCEPPIEPEATPECADPEFTGMHPTATEYQCVGQAGGNIIFRQVEVKVGANVVGGGLGSNPAPPDDPDDPMWPQLPSMDHSASACCYGLDPDAPDPGGQVDENLIKRGESGCQKDCARAACNEVIARLNEKLELSDVSEGACDPAPLGHGGTDKCRSNLRKTFESWVEQLDDRYDDCLNAAFNNTDPSLHYWDHAVPFSNDKKFVFTNPDCHDDELGCLFDAELRPFCDIQDIVEQSTCEVAGNPHNPDGPADPDTTAGDEEGGVIEDFGDIDGSVTCSPATTCSVLAELRYNVEYNFHLFYDEGVVLTLGAHATGITGLQLSGVNAGEQSKKLFDAFNFVNGDVITHVNSVAVDSWVDVGMVLLGIDSTTTWAITVRRHAGTSWSTRNYVITIVSAVKAPDAGGEDTSAAGSCGCTTESSPTQGILALLFAGFVGRRRRKAP